MPTYEIKQEVVDTLGSKLEAAELTTEERETLDVAFTLANMVVASAASDEVEGFGQPRPFLIGTGWDPKGNAQPFWTERPDGIQTQKTGSGFLLEISG